VLTLNTSGVITSWGDWRNWKTPQQMTNAGYEEIFNLDLDDDGEIGNNQSLGGNPLGSTARLLNREGTTFSQQSELIIRRKDEITGQEFELLTDVHNLADSVTWTEIHKESLEYIPSLENFLESRITSNENSIFDDFGFQVESLIDQENLSFYPNVERIIENDLEDQYLNDFSQSETQVNEEELFNSDILQDSDIQNNQVLI
jgi:hypothetical protein